MGTTSPLRVEPAAPVGPGGYHARPAMRPAYDVVGRAFDECRGQAYLRPNS